jgi:type II secretory pathway pseudopilin PulG
VVFHKKQHPLSGSVAFTLVEAVVAITLVGIGITSTVAALTKFNQFANVSRNSTGAYAVVMDQIDAIESATPFNPQKGQIPLALTTHTDAVDIYKDDATHTVVSGTRTTTVADTGIKYWGTSLTVYRATVTVTYSYLNRDGTYGPRYSFSMSSLRTSDE